MNAIDELRRLLGPVDPARTLPAYPAPPIPPPLATSAPADEARPARRRPRTIAVPGAAAAVVVTVALMVNPLTTDDAATAFTPAPLVMQYGTDPAPSPARYLTQLADRVIEAPSDATSGRYMRLTTKGWYLDTVITRDTAASAVVPMEYKLWLAPDGSGRETLRKLPPEFPDEDARERWRSLSPTEPPTDSTRDMGSGERHRDWPDGLPTDPAALAAALARPGDPVEPLLRVLNANRELIPDRDTRAALLRFLAGLDDLAYRGEVIDRAGRRGVAVSADTPDRGRREVLVFAPDTGELLAHETMIMAEPGRLELARYPAVVAYTLFLDRARVDRPGA
jgi:hypothetical protein